jgi:hypothetical protein
VSSPGLEDRLAAAYRLLEEDSVVEVCLPSVDQLVCEPPIGPLGRHGPYQSGAAYASSVLQSARRLPEQVTVRVVVSGDSFDENTNAKAETAFRDYCRFRAEDALRQAATVRRAGTRQRRPALILAAVVAAVAAACGYLGDSVDVKAAAALLYIIAGIGVIAAWIIVWQPVEELLFGWRAPAHLAAAFGFLSRARLEFIERPTPGRYAAQSPGS